MLTGNTKNTCNIFILIELFMLIQRKFNTKRAGRYLFGLAAFVFQSCIIIAQEKKTENIIIITIDGFRWQEVFGGADDSLINNPEFSFDTADTEEKILGY